MGKRGYYNETKAKRTIEYLNHLTKKQNQVTKELTKKSERLDREIKRIKESQVIVKCKSCNTLIHISISDYMKGKYRKLCYTCETQLHSKTITSLKKIISESGLNVKVEYNCGSVVITPC